MKALESLRLAGRSSSLLRGLDKATNLGTLEIRDPPPTQAFSDMLPPNIKQLTITSAISVPQSSSGQPTVSFMGLERLKNLEEINVAGFRIPDSDGVATLKRLRKVIFKSCSGEAQVMGNRLAEFGVKAELS